MIPPSFDYEKPGSIEETITLLKRYGADARIMAGGQSLILELKRRMISPKVVIDISGLEELRGIHRSDGSVAIGAMATQAALMESDLIRSHFPIFGEDALVISDPMIRRCGTFAGSLALGNPEEDWPAFALMLDAEIEITGSDGTRAVSIGEFFQDAFKTALAPTDLLTHIRLPVPKSPNKMVYRKVRNPASGYALVGVAVRVEQASDGTCSDCRVAITGAGRVPARARAVEDALRGQRLTPGGVDQAAEQALAGMELGTNLFAGPEYRKQLVQACTRRALREAVSTDTSPG